MPDRARRFEALRGLRGRLAIAIVAILAAALLVSFVAVYRGTGAEVRNQVDRDLAQDATGFARDGIPPDATTASAVARAARAYVALQPGFGASARLYVVRVTGGPVVTNEPELLGRSSDTTREGESHGTQTLEAAQSRLLETTTLGFSSFDLADTGPGRLLVRPVQRAGHTVAAVTVGEPLTAVDQAQDGVARTFALAGTLTLLLAVIASYVIATRLSRPLRRIARTATAVNGGDLSHRIRAHGPHDEVRLLADAFDHMLDRLEDAFARQRAFVADASHELRTPLTVIRGQLEVLARQRDVSPDDVRRVEATVRTEVARMERLVEDGLLLARADEHDLVRLEPIRVDTFVTELFDGLTLGGERRFVLGPLPGGTVLGDPDRIAQAVRNLTRNAVEHTPEGGLVRLTAHPRGDQLELAVEDDGPGIPTEQRERIFDRFHRTDRARTRTAGGAGLGLAIARAIVEAHAGHVFAGISPEGGARVGFTLPDYQATLHATLGAPSR